MTLGYYILATWGPRPATPEACAERAARMFETLGELHAALARWHFAEARPPMPATALDVKALAHLFAEGLNRESEDDEPFLSLGYTISAWNGLLDSRRIVIHVNAGGYSTANQFANVIDIRIEPAAPDNASLLAVEVLKPLVLAVAASWGVTWCDVAPFALSELLARDPGHRAPRYRGGWLTYIGPRFASLVKPPPTAITEYPPDGGILMTATEDRFDVDNPKHVAVARDIDAALSPLNALPWPPDSDLPPGMVVQ